MANKRANARAKASKMNASHSWPWVIVRVLQIAICIVVLGLSVYLRFTYKPSTLVRRDEVDPDADKKDDKKDYSTPPWLAPAKAKVNSGDDEFYNPADGKWGFSPLVSLTILTVAAFISLLSSFSSLLLYCLEKLSLKIIMGWDFLMAVVWTTGVVFIGKLITDNSGWGLNHTIANLYKLDFALGVIATVLFICSGGLAVHLMMAAKGSGGKYAPMTMAPPYQAPKSLGDTPTPVYTTYTATTDDPEHDAITKHTSDLR